MKVAVSTGGQDINARVSPIFGRCQNFVIAEIENGEIVSERTVENSGRDQTRGAGSAAAQMLGENGVEAVITGKVGTTSLMALDQLNVDLYKSEGGTVEENLDRFITGGLEEIENANAGPGGQRFSP